MRHHILDCTDRAYQVRVAKESDVESILELLVNAAEWLATKETSQWDYYITDLEGNTKEVVDSIAKASTFLVEIDNEVVASVTLEKEPNDWDQEIWGADSKREDVMYLHRLVVHRNYTNKSEQTC
nr:GNAT family N-acetyltransferase [Salirhabdus sp. Marseille-P4669]